MKKILLSLIALVATSVIAMADDLDVKFYVISNGQEVEPVSFETEVSQIEGFKVVVIDPVAPILGMIYIEDDYGNFVYEDYPSSLMTNGIYEYTFQEPIVLVKGTSTQSIVFSIEVADDETGDVGGVEMHVMAADAPADPIELEFTSAETEVYGSTLDVLLSGPDVELVYETHIVNKSIAGIHNDAKLWDIALTYDIEEELEDPILDGTAEFTFVSVDESGVYTYIVSFNLVGESGNEYFGEAEIQVEADLSNDVISTALENTNAEVKATKLVENGQVVILRDGKRYNAVGAEL